MLRILLTLAAVVVLVAGHGRVLGPPSRASMWRSGYATRANYDDDGLNCGGFARQYQMNEGKCGLCGDPYDDAEPRPHELGGIFGEGIIVADYDAGQVVNITVHITAYHRGYWIFKLCPDPKNTDQSCFDEYPLELEDGGFRFYPPHGGIYSLNYRLPKGLVCEHCVLQWRYIAGNNWGVCDDGTSGLGCGNQETFGACSDISIRPGVESFPIEAVPLDGIDQGLLDLLRNMILRPPPKKYNSKYSLKKRKNHRQPRSRNKHSKKRKKVSFW
ncbi:uncharacterized protein [Maniola hyperantus]|uniref:uncharacterized protein n=1 Tax=Aphantopus hyperantus TaxID=2795564 RepID=UPI0037492587